MATVAPTSMSPTMTTMAPTMSATGCAGNLTDTANTLTSMSNGLSMEAASMLLNFVCTELDHSATRVAASSTELAGKVSELDEKLGYTNDAVNGAFVLANTYLVFVMQAGFAMLCAGSVRSKNCMNILLKNILDACFGAPVFWLFGYGFAYGASDGGNDFIGNDLFGLDDFNDWSGFIFQWAFAAATATIVSGSVAERCSFQGYICYSTYLTGFVYPVVVHWIWAKEGWLSAFNPDPLWDTGMIDFAGSGVVHSVGGIAGLCGAAIIGPRHGRFLEDGTPAPNFEGHSMTLVVLGTFLLWFGWYGFNPGSMLGITTGGDNVFLEVVGRTAVTTTLAGASGGIGGLFRARIKCGHWDLGAACNALLAGLVGVTAGCSVIEPWAAILCGLIAAVWFDFLCDVLLKLKIDDPLAAAPMHGGCGLFGVFFVGLFAKKKYVSQAYNDGADYGIFYGGDGKLLGCQVVGMLSIIGWTLVNIGAAFMIMRQLKFLRVPVEEESLGLDVSHHGGSAYNMTMMAEATATARKEKRADDF